MAKKKAEVKVEPSGFYKGYDMAWLKKEKTHPDFYLVAEYESEQPVVEKEVEEEEEEVIEK